MYYACWLVSLFGPTTYCKFQMNTFKYSMRIDCPWPMCTLAKPWERVRVNCYCQTIASAWNRAGAKTVDSSWMDLQHCSTHGWLIVMDYAETPWLDRQLRTIVNNYYYTRRKQVTITERTRNASSWLKYPYKRPWPRLDEKTVGWYKKTGRCKDTSTTWNDKTIQRKEPHCIKIRNYLFSERTAWCKREETTWIHKETIWIHQYHYINLQRNYKEDWPTQMYK